MFITNNKYSKQVYVIKPSEQWKTTLYQGPSDRGERDRESDLNFLDSAISVNTLL